MQQLVAQLSSWSIVPLDLWAGGGSVDSHRPRPAIVRANDLPFILLYYNILENFLGRNAVLTTGPPILVLWGCVDSRYV